MPIVPFALGDVLIVTVIVAFPPDSDVVTLLGETDTGNGSGLLVT